MVPNDLFVLSKDQWSTFLKKTASNYEVIAPKDGPYHLEYERIGEEETDTIVFPGARLTRPLKYFFYPPRENVSRDPSPPDKKRVIFGIKACDLAALSILDNIYLDPDFVDPFYKTRRDNAIIVSDDCTKPLENCFCVLIDGTPFATKNFDLSLSFIEDQVLVELGSEKGKNLLDNAGIDLRKAGEDLLNRRQEQRQAMIEQLKEQNKDFEFSPEKLPELVKEMYDSPMWKEICETCVSCGACSNICPSCHCFLLTYNQSEDKKFEVLRTWDSCQSAGFSRVAGGANPREKLPSLFQNRFQCKIHYKPRNFGVFACTGCGRCNEACQGGIDIRRVLSLVAGEAASKSN